MTALLCCPKSPLARGLLFVSWLAHPHFELSSGRLPLCLPNNQIWSKVLSRFVAHGRSARPHNGGPSDPVRRQGGDLPQPRELMMEEIEAYQHEATAKKIMSRCAARCGAWIQMVAGPTTRAVVFGAIFTQRVVRVFIRIVALRIPHSAGQTPSWGWVATPGPMPSTKCALR